MKFINEYLSFSEHDQVVTAIVILTFGCVISVGFQRLGQRNSGLVDWDQAQQNQALYQVDLNEAAWFDLAVLPGIGEKLAKSIIEHRQQRGSFRSHEDLTYLRGIGVSKLAAIKPHLESLTGAGTERFHGRPIKSD